MASTRQMAAPNTHFHSMALRIPVKAPRWLSGIRSDWAACKWPRCTSRAPNMLANRRNCRSSRLRDVSIHNDPCCTRRWHGRTVPPRTVLRPQGDRGRLGTCSSPRRRRALGSRCTRRPPGRTAPQAEGVCRTFPALRPRRCKLGRTRKKGRRNDMHRPLAGRRRTCR